MYEEQLGLPLVHAGKVRELYAVDDEHLLLVASDRLSAYDVVLPTPVPDKGAVLTALSLWWFDHLADVVPHHLVSARTSDYPARLTAEITALSDAVTMLGSKPTPHRTCSPTAHSTYAAAMASPPDDSACSA